MSVRDILLAGREAGATYPRIEEWAALVVLVEQDAAGDPARTGDYIDQARGYPAGWSPVDLARYGPRIALRTPAVAIETGRLGIEVTGRQVAEAAETISEPITAVAAEPLRWLAWLQDPGTQVRIAKVIVGGALVITGLSLVALPYGLGTLGRTAKRAVRGGKR